MFRSAGALALSCALVGGTSSSAAALLLLGAPLQAAAPSAPQHQPGSWPDALHAAVRSANLEDVKRLVAAGADVNAPDALGSTPLLMAAWSGNTEIASFLVAHGADVNALQPQTHSTALEYAVLTGRTAMVQLLLQAGARIDTRYRDNQTILQIAAAAGNPQIVSLLLAAGMDIGSVDVNGNTALDQAVLHGQAAVVSLLIAHGADVKRVHPVGGRGPLHEACIKGFANLVQPLIDAGADPIERDRSGQTPLDLALAYKNAKIVAALLHLPQKDAEDAAEQAMESATLRGRTEIARMLIDSGFDISKPTAAGSTYLHDAALKGQKSVVQLLLERGAPVDALDQSGATALHNAALGGNADVIVILLDRGARIDAQDRESGATPLMLAASLGRAGAVALLLRRGANPALRDRAGHTALDRARETEEDDTVKLLETALARSKLNHPARTPG